jgi:hypothetical protein
VADKPRRFVVADMLAVDCLLRFSHGRLIVGVRDAFRA